MPRALRIQEANLLYHVGSRGVDRQSIFGVTSLDHERFLELLDLVVLAFGWRVHAYCLMGNHFHLIVDTPRANLAAGMQYLKGRFAYWFNGNKGREGALFERRYWYRIASSEAYVLELTRYVVLNPVRSGWCELPDDWQWSSYRATAGLDPTPRFLYTDDLLGWFGHGELARQRYRAFIQEPISSGLSSRPAEGMGSDPGVRPVDRRGRS